MTWLIQRGTFRKVKPSQVTGIDSLVNQDYMGSAEFEFGALRESLEKSVPFANHYEIHKTSYKAKDGRGLFILCPQVALPSVKSVLDDLVQDKIRLKEPSYLEKSLQSLGDPRIDFWWDIQNHWFLGYGKDNMVLLQKALANLAEKWHAEGILTQPSEDQVAAFLASSSTQV